MTRFPWPLVLLSIVCLATLPGCETAGHHERLNGLSAHLENARIGENDTVEVDFVLTNHGASEITLPIQVRSSRGPHQWTFDVQDATGRIYELESRHRGMRGYGSSWTFTIQPGATHVLRSRLDPYSVSDSPRDGFRRFSLSAQPQDNNDWTYPLTVTGYFTAFRENLSEGANWNGRIRTQTVEVGDRQEPDDDDNPYVGHWDY